MPIILITGANGHGKGQFIIKKILEIQDENDKLEKQGKPRRPIFANIHGVNSPNVKPLKDVQPLPENPYIFFGKQDNPDDPPPDNYFVPPIGSIFIYDEAQKIDWIQQKAGALSTDKRVKSLEEHRHAGLDIYLLTQSPNYIHSHIQGLVSPHYYLERPLGMPMTNVFMFNKFQARPELSSVKKKADDHQTMPIGKKLGAYYQSSAEHNMKSTIPAKLKFAVAGLIFIIIVFVYKAMQAKDYYEEKHDTTEQTLQQDQQDKKGQGVNFITSNNDLQNELASLEQQQALERMNRRIHLYQTQLPQDYQVVKQDDNLQVRGVIKMGNQCKAYNTHGDLMTLSQSECSYYIENTGRVHKPSQTSSSEHYISSQGGITSEPIPQHQPINQTQAQDIL